MNVNVCGLNSKLNIPEFNELIQSFDIITCTETKLDDLDVINVNQFVCITKNRRQKVIRKSGGIAVLIKESIFKCFECIDTECEYVLWFKLDKVLFNTDEDVYFGAIYIPPAYTGYSQADILDLFYQEVESFSRAHKYVLLQGDFNARTAVLPDVTLVDENILEQIGVSPESVYTSDNVDIMKRFNLDIQRVSNDNKVNAYGRNLIDFCRNNEMFILNGRAFSDKGIGATTCKDKSVVDYVICSSSSIALLSHFEIKEFCSLYSDAHSVIEFSLKSQIDVHFRNRYDVVGDEHKRWEEPKKQLFVENLDQDKIQDVLNKLNNITQPNKESINDIMSDIEVIFNTTRNNTFTKYVSTDNSIKTKSHEKRWFNNTCRLARKKYHLARRIYNTNKTQQNRQNLLDNSKQYKKEINKSLLQYKRSMRNKVRQMQQKSPKDFWNYVNSLNSKNCDPDIKIENLFQFFKDINSTEHDDAGLEEHDANNLDLNILNSAITEDEILNCIRKLKNGKCSGTDEIINEYIKVSSQHFLPIYIKLFNMILDCGHVPESWLIGVIKPIYKNKGDPTLPENYRPITILSCMGKLFTAILNTRLNIFLEENNILNETQCGFRKSYSTLDNIFVIHAIVEYLRVRKLKVYCAFIDFQKAFDSVWRVGLWGKLLNANVSGKILIIMKNIYADIKSCVSFNGESSEFFSCKNGLRQGENLSPILFSMFLNDLEHFLLNENNFGLNIFDKSLQDYLKLVVLLYADDTVLFAENEEELQQLLNKFQIYCSRWKLNVNPEKSKIVIFGDRSRHHNDINFNGQPIEIVDSFKYLGVILPKSRSFYQTKKHIADQARKALFGLYKKIRNLDLPIDCQLKLFDNTIVPILTYGSEIWGYGDLSIIEKVHTDFMKYILNVKKSTPHVMLYGELGRFPISLTIKKRTISFWSKLLLGKISKLSSRLYSILYDDFSANSFDFPWIHNVKSILDEVGMSNIWINQNPQNSNWLANTVFQKNQDQFKQSWSALLNESSKCVNYRMFKTEHKFEKYLISLPIKLRKTFTNYRLCNNRLPIETGRWASIDRNLRKCIHCNLNSIGDEYHYLFECCFFDFDRTIFLPYIKKRNANCIMFSNLFNETNLVKLRRLCKFLQIVLDTFKAHSR